MDKAEFLWYESAPIWAAIISFLFALISGIMTILLFKKKNSIIHKFSENLETHKSELTRTTNELQDKLRIEYGSLYQKRIDAITNLYSIIFEIKEISIEVKRKEYYNYHGLIVDYNKKINDFTDLANRFSTITEQSKIYFTTTDCKLLTTFSSTVSDIGFQMFEYYMEGCPEGFEEILNNISDIDPQLIENIENRFRILIGINDK